MPYKDNETKKLKDAEYRKNNKIRLKEYFKHRYETKKETILDAKKCYYTKTRKHHLQKMKEYASTHKEERTLYIKNNIDHIRKRDRIYYQKRMENDIIYKIRRNLRGRIHNALHGTVKKSEKTRQLLGCDIEFLK